MSTNGHDRDKQLEQYKSMIEGQLNEQAKRAIRLGKEEIFKFQRPLFSQSEPYVLVYNESKKWYGRMPMTDALFSLFAGESKFYASCVPVNTGQLYIMRFVEPREW